MSLVEQLIDLKEVKEKYGDERRSVIEYSANEMRIEDLIPKNFKLKNYKRTGKAGIFAGSLELVKEGNLKIKQDKLFEDVYVKENK